MTKQRQNAGDVFTARQYAIARRTMRLHCIGAQLMGGPNHREAARILGIKPPRGCTCPEK